jgi:arylsulfatase A-like enzyme
MHPPLPLLRNEEVIQEQPNQRGLTERYTEECISFIRQNQSKPFFLFFAHMYVHVPLFIPKKFLAISRNGAHGGALACIDWSMRVLDQELERLGLKEDTLVIFTSDNGSRAKDEGDGNTPLKGRKSQTSEGGQRVPMIARRPGHIKDGSHCDGIASSIDLYATLCDLIDTDMPKKTIDSLALKESLSIRGGVFITWPSHDHSPVYHARNITIQRSNVEIEGLKHLIEKTGKDGAPYGGFLSISRCANVVVKDSIFTGRRTYWKIGSAKKRVLIEANF